MHQVDVRYSEALVRQAVRAFYWRTLRERFGWPGILAFIVSLAALVFLVLGGDRSWIVGAVGACLLFVVLVFLAGYIAHHRNTVGRLRRMTNPQARLVFSDRDVSISSELGSATMLWDAVREVWAFPGFWLFLLSRSSFFTFPTEGVAEDVLAFVRSKTRVS
jgi:YcxB-like protein